MVEHSKNTRLLAYFCALILIPGFSFFPVAFIYILLTTSDFELNMKVIFMFLTIFTISYVSAKYLFLFVRFISTLKVKLTFDIDGISVNKNHKIVFYTWEQLSNSKHYPSCQTFCLIDEQNRHIVSLWEYATDYHQLREVAHNKLGI